MKELESGSGLELHFTVVMGELKDVKYLVEKKNCNPMQRDQNGFASFHVAATVGNFHAFKYFITESNCQPSMSRPTWLNTTSSS